MRQFVIIQNILICFSLADSPPVPFQMNMIPRSMEILPNIAVTVYCIPSGR